MIKIHPQAGHDILKIIEFPWPIAQIVLQHHERMDGSGYPGHLSGKDIILEGGSHGFSSTLPAGSWNRQGIRGNLPENGGSLKNSSRSIYLVFQ
jgi:hypothetical protein